MKNLNIILFALVFLATTASAKYVCSLDEFSWFTSRSYTEAASNSKELAIILDDTVKIDKKNKQIEVWIVYAATDEWRLEGIEQFGDKYQNFGYMMTLNVYNYQKNLLHQKHLLTIIVIDR